MMREITESASVLYAPALAEVIGFEFIPDKPRIRGCILVTFRDERGALVTIRLLRTAADGLLRALATGPVAQITDMKSKSLPDLIEGQSTTLVDATPPYDPIEAYPKALPGTELNANCLQKRAPAPKDAGAEIETS
jgi:hypothetical protein